MLRMRTIAVTTFAAALSGASPLAAAPDPSSHPPEVALVDEGAVGSVYRETTQSLRLYTSDADPAGKSVCNRGCAAAWPPLRAPDNAAPVGEWSLVRRDNGWLQWAYRGKPVYLRFHDAPNAATGAGIPGWHVIPYISKAHSEIAVADALAATAAIWGVIDANGDGALDDADRVPQRDLAFARIDTDKDGALSTVELKTGSPEFRSDSAAHRSAWFARLDLDANGKLSRDELIRGGAGELPAERSARTLALFDQADANRDKRVTRAEFDIAVERHIARIDTNKDGRISKAEHDAGRALVEAMGAEQP